MEGGGLLKMPRRVDRPMGKNQEEYCIYHRTRGHSTDHCKELKNQIEMIIQEGHLQRYVRNKGGKQLGASTKGRQTLGAQEIESKTAGEGKRP